MKGRPISYSSAELAWIEANCRLPIDELHRQFCETFGRADASTVNLHSLRKRKGWSTGRSGRFEKGMVPPNKGKKMPFNPNSARTQFRKGERRGVAVRLYKPVGTERISKDGYRERKIHDGLPLQSRWRAVHLIEWEAIHGRIPSGHALKCLDGDKHNCDASNWELVPRALLPRLNGRFGRNYEGASPEAKPTILAIAKLEHRSRELRKQRD
jgi:hypothetical protein